MEPIAVSHFCGYLRTRNYSPHTIENYGRDLRLFFAPLDQDPCTVSWREVDAFIQQQHAAHLAATTINRRLNAVKHFFAYLVRERQALASNPVKPSHFLRRGRPLPKQLSQDQVRTLFAQITHPMDHALGLLMLRCGLRVSEVARLRLRDIDWEQQSLRIDQGKGRKDRIVYLAADVLAALRTCLALRPAVVPDGLVLWNQKRPHRALSSKGIQKKIERYAKAAGIQASCHSLRHTFASNLLEAGAEVITIKELLGHASIESSERYAKRSNQRVKQVYQQTIRKVIAKTRVEEHDVARDGRRRRSQATLGCPLQRERAGARGVGLQKHLEGPPGNHAAIRLEPRLDLQPVDIAVPLRQEGDRDTQVDDGGGRSWRAPSFFLRGWGCFGL